MADGQAEYLQRPLLTLGRAERLGLKSKLRGAVQPRLYPDLAPLVMFWILEPLGYCGAEMVTGPEDAAAPAIARPRRPYGAGVWRLLLPRSLR